MNPELQAVQDPLPHIEDIFANPAGGQKFSDCPPSSLPPIRNGRRFKEIPHYSYGNVSVQPTSVWHHFCTCYLATYSTIDHVLEGTSGTSCTLDDMIITGKNDEAHLANLEEVLRRLQVYGLRANKAKCEWIAF